MTPAERCERGAPDGATTRRPPDAAPLRIAVALDDHGVEGRLLGSLAEADDVAVVARCMTVEELLARVARGGLDAVLAGHGLHRLGEALPELRRARLPLVLLAPAHERSPDGAARVLPPEASPEDVRRALHAAVDGRGLPPAPAPRGEAPAGPTAARPEGLAVLALWGGHGSPGRTTLAVSLAAVLGAREDTILVDLDVSGPTVAAFLDADRSRNVYMLTRAAPETAGDWDRLLAAETRPLGVRSPRAVVLCGVPRIEVRAALGRPFVERLVAELRVRYRYVVLDVGAELLGAEVAPHRAALALADRVLLPAAPDVPGLYHARRALEQLGEHVGVGLDRVSVVVNRHDRRVHDPRDALAWALSAPVAFVVPHDPAAANRALGAHRPLVYEERSPAARALVRLAEQVDGGTLGLAPDPAAPPPPAWRRLLARAPRPRRPRPGPAPAEGGPVGGRDAVVRA